MKRLLLSVILALVMVFAVSGIALADDPTVSVTVDTPLGDVTVATSGVDTSAWHLGSVGQMDTFRASGGFTASYISTVGTYGRLNTAVNASGAYGTGAQFQLDSYQDFNILSANHINNVEGYFTAIAANLSNNQVALNLKSVGSMYVWSEATNPYSQPGLRGMLISKEARTEVGGTLTALLREWVTSDGVANMSNSNIWGWGIGETGTPTTNYGGGIRNVSATGNGQYGLYGAGGSLLNINGSVTAGNGSGTITGSLPSGGAISYIFNYLNGMTGTYSMNAK